MVNVNWPLTVTNVAFVGDPFDANATPTYTDISKRAREFTASSGRQYELDTVQAGEATYVLRDDDEALNPSNPASTYYPNVRPYRQIREQAMWPPTPVGGAVNLLVGQISPTIDPTFESYTNGASLSWVLTVGAGVSPTVSTSNPQQGTKSLQYTVTSGGGENGAGFTVTTIPGQQYTASLYLRQTAANTSQIFVNGGAAGTSTSVTGSYQRLTVTFTATSTSHQIWVASFTTPNTGTVNLDALQVEPGTLASTFSSASGPVIYGMFGGFVERWPSKWNHKGTFGVAEITAVDGFAILSQQFLQTEYTNAVLAKTPAYYWRLNEPAGATTFAETSGNLGPSLIRYDSKYGAAATFTTGSSTAIAGDPSGAGVLVHSGATTSNSPLTIIQTGLFGTSAPVAIASATTPWSITWAWWIKHDTQAPSTGSPIFGRSTDSTITDQGGFWQVVSGSPSTMFWGLTSVTDTWGGDGKFHLFIGVRTASGGNLVDTLYVDGTQVATTTTPGTFAFGVNTLIELGADINLGFSRPGLVNATYAHLAIWNRALTTGEITDLWNAGQGYPSEGSGARVTRYLGYNWTGATAIDTGLSTMGVSTLANDTSILDAVLGVTQAENGVSFVDGSGSITFYSRNRRYLNLTPKWSFGETGSPYEDDIAFDYDPTLVFNDVRITRSGGVTAVGGTLAAQQTSIKRYGKRSQAITVNIASDAEAQDHANWIFYGHADPIQRVATLTLKPSANTALWPVCLGLKIGDRATVRRQTTAGYTMNADYFVERIEQHRKPGEWTFSLQLSPAATQLQPGILDDTTYGRWGSAGAVLLSGITNSATSATASTTGTTEASSTFTTATDSNDCPFVATIDSEKVTVTAVAGLLADTFTRTVSNGWGSADTGQAWTTTGGSAANYSTNGTVGQINNASVNVARVVSNAVSAADIENTVQITVPALATGAAISVAWLHRFTDTSNHYRYLINLNTDETVDLQILKVVTGTVTSLASLTGVLLYTASSVIAVRAKILGSNLYMKVWLNSGNEPPGWQLSATDNSLTAASGVGVLNLLNAGNTNASPVFSFDNITTQTPQTLTVIRPTDGTAVAHSSGAAVQVANPFLFAF